MLKNHIQLNSKYINTKQNQKLEEKIFRPFQIFYFVGNKLIIKIAKTIKNKYYFLYTITKAENYQKRPH